MIEFTVYGNPKSKGSLHPFVNRKTGQALMVRGKSSAQWEQLIRSEAQRARTDECPFQGAVAVHLYFLMQAAKTGKAAKRVHPITKPDIDKLCRAVLDGLTGIFFNDDSQVILLEAIKRYGTPSVKVQVTPC